MVINKRNFEIGMYILKIVIINEQFTYFRTD
jgi:hypothetical protein